MTGVYVITVVGLLIMGMNRYGPCGGRYFQCIIAEDYESRGIYNPYHHFPKNEPLEGILRLPLVCQSDSRGLLEVIMLTHNRASLSDASLEYCALSYCWGDISQTKSIMLNHVHRLLDKERGLPRVCFRHTFNITANLHSALCRLEMCLHRGLSG